MIWASTISPITQRRRKSAEPCLRTSDPPIIHFNAIEDLSNLSQAPNIEKLHQQIINSGLEILR